MIEILDKVVALGETLTQTAVTEYARWYFVSALSWLTAGVVGWCSLGIAWCKRGVVREVFEAFPPLPFVIAAISTFAILLNVPTICAPRAYAIHALIHEVK